LLQGVRKNHDEVFSGMSSIETAKQLNDELRELFDKLAEANVCLKDATATESAARSQVCEATNRVNKLQRDIDAKLMVLRSQAQWNTDWHSQRQPKIGVPS
jgi:hypothetical protein